MEQENTQALQPAQPENKKGILQISKVQGGQDFKNRLMTVGFYGLGGFLGWRFLLKPFIDNMRRDREQKEIGNDPNKQQATILYTAMNTSGISWMRSFDQTNEAGIFEAARNITDWNAVQSTYKKLYSRNLLEDIQSELDTDEFKTFMSILNTSGTRTDGGGGIDVTTRGYLVAATQNIRIRSTPDSSTDGWSLTNNIIGVIKQGNFIGFSSGDFKVDDKGVKFIKVAVKFINTVPDSHKEVYDSLKSKAMAFWVGKGAVTQHKYFSDMLKKYPSMKYDGKNVSDLGLRAGIK